MHVVLLNNYPGHAIGGGEVQLLALVRGLLARGSVRVTVVCAVGSRLEQECRSLPGVDVVPVSFAPADLPLFARRLNRLLTDVDIVQGTGFLTNLLARSAGRLMGALVVNAVHVVPGASRFDGGSNLGVAMRSMLDRYRRGRVHAFVAVSGAVAAALEATGVDPARILVIPNGVDVEGLRHAASSAVIHREDSAFRMGFFGRLEPIKGCDYAIRAVAKLRERQYDVRLKVAGSGSQDASLRSLAAELDVSDRVDFLGTVPSVAPHMASCDVVVVPSLSEAFGLTAAEALALGVPVVASKVGGLPEVVVDGVTGLLVPPADASAIADAVAALVDAPELASQMGGQGSAMVSTRFSTTAMVDGYARMYEDLSLD